MGMVLSEQVLGEIREAAAVLVDCSYVVGLTGAGVSVESGIRPFRGPGGLWTERGEPAMDGYQRFVSDPKGWWENRVARTSEFGSAIESAKPNPGHLALAELEEMGVMKSLITQNIDNLHKAAGSVNVLEIHGNRTLMRCVSCNTRWRKEEFKVDELPPKCPHCGGVVKGDTVMFGEPIPTDVLDQCFMEANRSDCMLVAGTSATVHPAASLPLVTRRNGGRLVEVNLYTSELSQIVDVMIMAPSGESLPVLVEEVRKLI